MASSEEDDDDFDRFMEEVEREAKEAAEAYFQDLYEASHGVEGNLGDEDEDEDEDENEDEDQRTAETEPSQRKSGLKDKLKAHPEADFPVSPFSTYNQKRWVLIKACEFQEVSIIIDNCRPDLQSLKAALCYHLLPSTHPFGTVRSYRSSETYSSSFVHVQNYLFEANFLEGLPEHFAAISSDMLNQALDDAKVQGSARAYSMLFFLINFWLSLSAQKILPDALCLNVDPGLVDTHARRKDVLKVVAENFTGWKPFTEDELSALLKYAFFWIDDAVPVITDIQNYLAFHPQALDRYHYMPERDPVFEANLSQTAKGVEVVGFRRYIPRRQAQCCRYTWRKKYRRAVDRVRNAILIMFCIMTGMRRREMAPLTFDDVVKGCDGVWRVSFIRYKTSSDPNFAGEPDELTIPNYLGEAIEAYKSLRMFDGNYRKGYLFQSVSGTHQVHKTDKMLLNVMRAIGNEVGIDGLHLHRFRKTIAEMLIHDSEKNIDIIRMIFGHSTYVMTLRYIARNPFLVSSVVETLKQHLASDFVDVVRAIHTGIYAGEGARQIASQVNERPDLFGGKVLKTTIMQFVSHMLEGGAVFKVQRTSLGTMCLTHVFYIDDELPPCLKSKAELIFPAYPDFSNCHIGCHKNIVLESSKEAIEHNIKFYRTLLLKQDKLKRDVVSELQEKISINQRLLSELSSPFATSSHKGNQAREG
nr:site-specific integrase [uncultured Pseudomonas sp.]